MERNHDNDTQTERAYIYATAANGITVRIPADKYDEWKEGQDRIRRGEKVEPDPETVKRLSSLVKGEMQEPERKTPHDITQREEQNVPPPPSPPKKRLPKIESLSGLFASVFFFVIQIFVYSSSNPPDGSIAGFIGYNFMGLAGIFWLSLFLFINREWLKELINRMKSPCQDSIIYTEKEQKIMNILTSKRIASVISIFLCAVLYFALLTTVFTKKVDTLIVYTQEGSEYIHGITNCDMYDGTYSDRVYRIDKSKPIISTTLYDCPDKLGCCLTVAKNTTITTKNYIAPLLISLPISALTFVILTYKKKPY